jgi:hypothetical protein
MKMFLSQRTSHIGDGEVSDCMWCFPMSESASALKTTRQIISSVAGFSYRDVVWFEMGICSLGFVRMA